MGSTLSEARAKGRRSHPLREVFDSAIGHDAHPQPISAGAGGPAGNAGLTAWLGLLLLPLFALQAVTLLSLHSLIGVHIYVGAFLIPIVLAKTISTGYRIARYYTRDPRYVESGPPPLLLRLLGPFVVLSGLAVVGTGISLIALGQGATFESLFSVAGFRVSALTLHQAAAIFWATVTGIHLLARFVPALQQATGRDRATQRRIPGFGRRGAVMAAILAIAAATGILVLHLSGDWSSLQFHHRPPGGRFFKGQPPG